MKYHLNPYLQITLTYNCKLKNEHRIPLDLEKGSSIESTIFLLIWFLATFLRLLHYPFLPLRCKQCPLSLPYSNSTCKPPDVCQKPPVNSIQPLAPSPQFYIALYSLFLFFHPLKTLTEEVQWPKQIIAKIFFVKKVNIVNFFLQKQQIWSSIFFKRLIKKNLIRKTYKFSKMSLLTWPLI